MLSIAYQTFGSNKLANHLSSMFKTFQSKVWLGKILANWLSFIKLANNLPLQYFATYSVTSIYVALYPQIATTTGLCNKSSTSDGLQ